MKMISLRNNGAKKYTWYTIDCGNAILNFEYDNVKYKLSKKCMINRCIIYSGGHSGKIYNVDLNNWRQLIDPIEQYKRLEEANVKFKDMIDKLQELIDIYNFGLDGPVYNENIL